MKDSIEYLLVIGLMGMLYLLRLDAQRFGVAEYDDSDRNGDWRSWLRRLGWYGLGVALLLLVYWLYPHPVSVLHLDMGPDREQALIYGLAAGVGGILLAFLFAWFRYGGFRLPAPGAYPGAILNSVGTAVVDEALFRGILLGLLLHQGLSVPLAIAIQAIAYGIATRLWVKGRSKGMLFIDLVIALVAGGAGHRHGHHDRRRDHGRGHRCRGHLPRHHPLQRVPRHRARRPGTTGRLGARGGRRPGAAAKGLGSRRRGRVAGLGRATPSGPPGSVPRTRDSRRSRLPGYGGPGLPRPAGWGAAAGHQQRAHERPGRVPGCGVRPGAARPGSHWPTRTAQPSGPWVADPVTEPGPRRHRPQPEAGPWDAGRSRRRAGPRRPTARQRTRRRGSARHRRPRMASRTARRPPRGPSAAARDRRSGCISTSRSASRCVPYCDFVVVTGRAAIGPANRIADLVAALHAELDLRADLADADVRGAPAALPASTSVAARRRCCPQRRSAGCSTTWRAASASMPGPRSPSRPTRDRPSWATWPASAPRV